MRPLTITGSVTGCAVGSESFGSFSRHSGSVSTANGTGLEAMSSLAHAKADRCPGPCPWHPSSTCRLGRFQPFSSTVVCVPARPPSGKMLVTNGSSPSGDAIDEIRPAAVEGVLDLDHVLAVFGDLVRTAPGRDGSGSRRRRPVPCPWRRRASAWPGTSRARRRPGRGSTPARWRAMTNCWPLRAWKR